jgi:hypothetical protein
MAATNLSANHVRKFALLCVFGVIMLSSNAQSTWVKRYSYSDTLTDYINLRSISVVNEGIFIIGSEEHADDPTGWKLMSYLLDLNGEVLNNSLFGEPWEARVHGWANSCDVSHEGGFINGGGFAVWAIDGEPIPEDEVIYMGNITHFSSAGELEWSRLYGDSIHFHTLRQIKATSDGGYIAVGQAAWVDHHPQIWVLKVNSIGDVEWEQFYGGNGPNDYYAGWQIAETPSGDYVFVGYYDWQPYITTGIIYKINAQGSFITSSNVGLGEVPNGTCEGIMVLYNGDVLTTTQKWIENSLGDEIRVCRIHRLDSDLNNVWVVELGEDDVNTTINHFIQLDNHTALGVGTANTYVEWPIQHGHITKINLDNGEIIWQRLLNVLDYGMNYLFDVEHSPDGGFVAAGWCLQVPGDEFSGQQDAWVVKVDEYGCLVPGCHVGVLEQDMQVGFKTYPNPATDVINMYIESNKVIKGRFVLTNTAGQRVYEGNSLVVTPQEPTTYMHVVTQYPRGLYVLSFESDEGVVSEKVVLE